MGLSLPATSDSKCSSDAVKWAFNAFNSTISPPFDPLPPLLSTWKNVSRCAWRFIKFELRHGIEFRHRRRYRGSSKELEKPSLERRKWMSGAESRKKSKGIASVLKRYPANCFWSFWETSVFGHEPPITCTTYLDFFTRDPSRPLSVDMI